MNRYLSLGILTVAFILPACSSQAPDPEPTEPPPQVVVPVIPPPPPAFVDPLPEFKKESRAYLDLAKKLDTLARSDPPPPYQIFWKEFEPLEGIYNKVISHEPKLGPGASTFDRLNKIRDSLFQTRLHLKNTGNFEISQVVELLKAEAEKRRPFFEEAEFFWKQTPEATPREDQDVLSGLPSRN